MARDDVNTLPRYISFSSLPPNARYGKLHESRRHLPFPPQPRRLHSFAGRGLYIFRSLAVGATSAALLGTSAAILGGMAFGAGSIPFMIGASVGFQGGFWLHYNHSLLQAMAALHDFPGLLLLHLDANFPLYKWRQKKWGGKLDGARLGWLERSMLVTAWQSAGAAVEVGNLNFLHEKAATLWRVTGIEIQTQRENAIVRDIVERATSSAALPEIES